MKYLIETAREITLGDIIGCVALFAIIPLALFAGLVMS